MNESSTAFKQHVQQRNPSTTSVSTIPKEILVQQIPHQSHYDITASATVPSNRNAHLFQRSTRGNFLTYRVEKQKSSFKSTISHPPIQNFQQHPPIKNANHSNQIKFHNNTHHTHTHIQKKHKKKNTKTLFIHPISIPNLPIHLGSMNKQLTNTS